MLLADVGQHAERGRRRAGEHEEPAPGHQADAEARDGAPRFRMVQRKRGADHAQTAADADGHDRRSPIALEAVAPVEEAGEEHHERHAKADAHLHRREAAHQQLILEAGSALVDQLEDRLARPGADEGVHRDPGRRQQPDRRARQQATVAGDVEAMRDAGHAPGAQLIGLPSRDLGGPGAGLGHAVPIDQEADPIEHRIEIEGVPIEQRPQAAGGDEAEAQPGQGGGLELRNRPSAQPLIVRGGERDVAEDRRDAGCGGGALQPSRRPEQEQVGGDRGHDDGNGAEHRPELHHRPRADTVGQHPEDR